MIEELGITCMASGTIGNSNDDLNSREGCRWTENFKVYTRKTQKKARKTCNNDDSASTSTSVAEKHESATLSPSRNQAPSSAGVAAATTADAEVFPASRPPTIPSSTTLPNGNASIGIVVAEDVDSCQNLRERSPLQDKSCTNGAPDKKDDSFRSVPLLQQKERQNVHSVVEDNDGVEEGRGSQSAELRAPEDSELLDSEAKNLVKTPSPDGVNEATNLEKMPSPDGPDGENEATHLEKTPSLDGENVVNNLEKMPSLDDGENEAKNLERTPSPNRENEAKNLEKTPSPDGENELVQRSEPSLFRENDLPNGRDVSAERQPLGDDVHNDGMVLDSAQPSHGNGLIKVNGAVEPPQVSKEQLAVGDEAQVAQDDVQMMPGSPQVSEGNARGNVNGVVKPLVISSIDDRIRFNLCRSTSKNEIKTLMKNLEHELDQVRTLVKQLESKELQLASHNSQITNSNLSNISAYISAEGANAGEYIHPQPLPARNNIADRRLLVRVNSEVGAMGHQENRPIGLARVNSDMGAARNLEPRVYNRQLSVAVMDSRSNEFVEKEKRTPKANQYYRNSEFLLGKDRLPSEGNNKRLKTNNGRKHSGDTDHSMGYGYGYDKNRNHAFKNCSSLLQRLMKHKYGWVFNEPVNAKALGLVDYHDIIKHPMDLGTIKTRLSQNFYKSPRDFSEDVRLVFHNAMTYNPKGQDVHTMAEQLLQIFEERWAVIESEYNSYWKYPVYQDGGLNTPTSRKGVPYSHFGPASVSVSASSIPPYASGRTSDRQEPVTSFMAVDPKIHRPHVGRTPVARKPKAKDPNKRDMTYEEKQRLSTNLQGLPPEKLDSIVQIIKKRNTALSQHDDEIEVDIDSVDAETLWELDRFVTNYKKSLSKNKRKAELALQARSSGSQNVRLMVRVEDFLLDCINL